MEATDGYEERQRIAKRIREFRKASGMTQVDLARKLSLTQGAVSQIELGATLPLVPTLCQMARAMGVKAGDILD